LSITTPWVHNAPDYYKHCYWKELLKSHELDKRKCGLKTLKDGQRWTQYTVLKLINFYQIKPYLFEISTVYFSSGFCSWILLKRWSFTFPWLRFPNFYCNLWQCLPVKINEKFNFLCDDGWFEFTTGWKIGARGRYISL